MNGLDYVAPLGVSAAIVIVLMLLPGEWAVALGLAIAFSVVRHVVNVTKPDTNPGFWRFVAIPFRGWLKLWKPL